MVVIEIVLQKYISLLNCSHNYLENIPLKMIFIYKKLFLKQLQ